MFLPLGPEGQETASPTGHLAVALHAPLHSPQLGLGEPSQAHGSTPSQPRCRLDGPASPPSEASHRCGAAGQRIGRSTELRSAPPVPSRPAGSAPDSGHKGL
uniref:Uncharacterized protein n=1 Tax=Sphaerodactylus townsendi TaxID=933632 RepID=A0ACB8F3M2_9SAUR